VNARSRRLARIGTILAIGLGVFVLSIPLLAGVIGPLLPHSVQDPVGRQTIEAAREDAAFCSAEPGLAALDRLADRLIAKSGLDSPVHVYVVDGKVLNAFAAPGGHIVIFRPIIEEAHDPDELAGVLAHEMAHEIESHPAEGLVQMLGYGVFGLLTPGGDNIGKEVATHILQSTYSRDDELDADHRGVQLLNDAGIDSHGLARFFATMKDKGGEVPGALEFLSTHPTGEHRQEALKDLAREGEHAMSDADWAALRGICSSTTKTATFVGS
jgi:beta-barrel assembly-enhancing protease